MGRLGEARVAQDRRIELYKERSLGNSEFNDMLIAALDVSVLNPTTLPKVLNSWRNPEHPEFKDRNLWSGFNAFTEHYKGTAMNELAKRTLALHALFDGWAGVHFQEAEATILN
jgi:hypothetical protein